MSHEYESLRRVCYAGGATFVPVCSQCGRFVRAANAVKVGDDCGLSDDPNAECSKCGPTTMLFEGFLDTSDPGDEQEGGK